VRKTLSKGSVLVFKYFGRCFLFRISVLVALLFATTNPFAFSGFFWQSKTAWKDKPAVPSIGESPMKKPAGCGRYGQAYRRRLGGRRVGLFRYSFCGFRRQARRLCYFLVHRDPAFPVEPALCAGFCTCSVSKHWRIAGGKARRMRAVQVGVSLPSWRPVEGVLLECGIAPLFLLRIPVASETLALLLFGFALHYPLCAL